MEQSQRIGSAAPHQPQHCQQQQERKLPPIELLNEQQHECCQEQPQIHPTQMSSLLLPNTVNNDAASHNNSSSMMTMIRHGSPASSSSSSSTTPGLRAMSTESTSSDGSSSHNTPSPQQLNATDDDSCQPDNSSHDNNCMLQEPFLPWWATSQPQEQQQLPRDLSSYHQTELQQQTPLVWSNSSATTTSLTGDELGSGTDNDNHNLLVLRSLSVATAICQQQQQQRLPDWRMSQKIYRPRPTRPARMCRPDPIQIEVPFLVNLTTHGPQQLSTVYEEDAIAQEEQQDKERPVQHSSSQSRLLQCPQACYASFPRNDSSCSYETDPNHPGPYYPAAQDFDHDGPFLSQALQLHVLEETRPVVHSDHHPYVYFSTDHSVAGERPQGPPSCPLVRPQALRVVCPTTMMAPIVRQEGVPDLQDDNDDPASFWKDHDSHSRNHAIIINNNEEYSY